MAPTWNRLTKFLSRQVSSTAHSSSTLSASESQPPRSSSASDRSVSSILSRSISSVSSHSHSQKTCAICLGRLKAGKGQAIFTAECSHTFHFNCIAASVKHGNYLCPMCRCKWKDIPFQPPSVGNARVSPYHPSPEDLVVRPNQPTLPRSVEPTVFSDDEPLPAVVQAPPAAVVHPHPMTVKSCPEYPAVSASESCPAFAVLVGVQAPSLPNDDSPSRERAPIDLVAVLDVSGSMSGPKLSLLKSAVCFVIENLSNSDRLSIVSFSSTARRIFPLRRMSDRGREDAILAVNSLLSSGGTNIVEGLKKGARVLEERREQNPVSSIILLSDGKDTYHYDNFLQHGDINLLPASIRRSSVETRTIPVHTFGFGSDHDSTSMHGISDASGGTFSFIESADMIQDAFARCIGGLLSVVAQEVKLTIKSASPGVQILSILSGRYLNEISDQRQQGVVHVGYLYADEGKEFLVNLSIPASLAAQGGDMVENMALVDVVCSHNDPLSKETFQAEGERVEIRRAEIPSPTDLIPCLDVDRQRNRLSVAEGIAEAQRMAESGNLEGARSVLENRRSTLLSSASAQAGDGLCNLLEAELSEMTEKMATLELYQRTGRAYVLSGLSSHSWQRATTRGDSTTHTMVFSEGENSGTTGAFGYETPSMVTMVTKSQILGHLPQEKGQRNGQPYKSCNLPFRRK
ncbi:VWA-Hint protein, Vwaint domain [Dillenia turbinata]|uniref:VWA-Hint protein, Vwaint domain n=1 Tax=Dillenia turbinata TaxID=194707 RepID=A0AAN8UW02_9MAGN